MGLLSIQSVLITGVAGFLGRYIARHFFEKGWRVIGIDITSPENAPLSYLESYYSLILPSADLERILVEKKPDCCVHCAGRAAVSLSMTDPLADYQSGPPLVFFILNSLRRVVPDCKFVFLSSAAVYGNPVRLPVAETDLAVPLSPYGYHKWQSELIVEEFARIYKLPTASIRIFSAYGPGLRRQVLWDICRKIFTESTVILHGTGYETRDFIHALDVALGVEIVTTHGQFIGEAYNLASGVQVAIKDIASKLVNHSKLEKIVTFDGEIPSGTPRWWQADTSRIEKLGFHAQVNFESGLMTFTDWCRTELNG
ncbi:MAG: dTDP-glucose 4,6-dehydratase [Chloroflexi bacterium HGW-Chloroflexi-6]|nr:MAG: dTDP-glucose 4,6-dehydratase [Chloroflexi bacterium HGW-Chloroflexi-6]